MHEQACADIQTCIYSRKPLLDGPSCCLEIARLKHETVSSIKLDIALYITRSADLTIQQYS